MCRRVVLSRQAGLREPPLPPFLRSAAQPFHATPGCNLMSVAHARFIHRFGLLYIHVFRSNNLLRTTALVDFTKRNRHLVAIDAPVQFFTRYEKNCRLQFLQCSSGYQIWNVAFSIKSLVSVQAFPDGSVNTLQKAQQGWVAAVTSVMDVIT
jgi:hypothetical protein